MMSDIIYTGGNSRSTAKLYMLLDKGNATPLPINNILCMYVIDRKWG